MARLPAPPGPPPANFRPPGTTAPLAPSSGPLGRSASQPDPPQSGASPAAVIAVALVALLVGGVLGFFVGRAAESGEQSLRLTPLTSPSTSQVRPPGDTVPQGPSGGTPSTDLDPTEIGTFDQPIPAGQAYILGLYEIEVTGADLDAGPELADFDELNPAAPEGRQHVLVRIAVRFTDRDGLGNPASIPFFLTDGTGEWHDFEATCGRIPEPLVDTGLIEMGDEAAGHACFTVPSETADSMVLGTDGFAGPLHFALPR